MKLKTRHMLLLACAAAALPVVGYVVAYGITLGLPMSEQPPAIQAVFILAIIIGLLAVPYWILKLGVKAAHEINPEERELKMKDIPKDQEQLNRQ